jgi:succinoglycan biosynthesis protein ExoM
MLDGWRSYATGSKTFVPAQGFFDHTAQARLICIGVCTAGRPNLLSKCLDSLAEQKLPRDAACVIVIADNNAEPKAHRTIQAIANHFPFPILYTHEKRKGISFARNRVLEEALAIGAGWIAFIDDDETASPEWLAEMILARDRYQADVIQGPVKPSYPDPMPFWASPKPAELKEGENMKFAATGNVLFSASLIQSQGMGLRFDEAMALSGGEDTDFFLRAKLGGAKIVYSDKPGVFEEVPPERLTFTRQMRLAYRTGSNDVYIKSKLYGGTRIFIRRLPQICLRLIRGVLEIALAPFFAPFSLGLFKQTALEGGWKLFKSLGVLAGLAGSRPGAYRKIDGH